MSRSPRVLVIYKRSAYEIYVGERQHPRVAELLAAGDASVSNLMRAHETHLETLESARTALRGLGVKAVFRRRSDLESDEHFDLVITLGGDGTLLWASHMVGSRCPVLAINSAPEDSVGYFCAADGRELQRTVSAALAGELKETKVTRLRIDIDGEPVHRRVLNDVLFSHTSPAATTRYAIAFDGTAEEHKSSGVWVSTAAGSSAAMHSAGGSVQPATSRRLQFRVREPYQPSGVSYRLLKGFIAPGERLELTSHIRAARLFIDGPRIAHNVDIGARITVQISDEPLLLLGFERR